MCSTLVDRRYWFVGEDGIVEIAARWTSDEIVVRWTSWIAVDLVKIGSNLELSSSEVSAVLCPLKCHDGLEALCWP